MVKIKYVGAKPFATDNVARSNQTWAGNGDVKEVTEAQAVLLLRHPDQWALAEENSELVAKPAEARKPVEKMDKNELEEYARVIFGVELDKRRATRVLRDEVLALEAGSDVHNPAKGLGA